MTGVLHHVISSVDTNSNYKSLIETLFASFSASDENPHFMANMKQLIEETMRINRKTPVVLLCHSMGCTFTYYFLRHQSQAWKDEFVKALFIAATPWDGNFKYFYSYIDNDDDIGASLFPAIREAERTFSALAFLLPDKRSFGSNYTLLETKDRRYTTDDYQAFFASLNRTDAYDHWTVTSKLLGNFEHPEVNIYCLGGVGVPTMSKLVYDGRYPLGSKRLLYDDGDGVLLAKSMRGCLRWKDTSKTGKRFYFKEFPATTHMGIIQDREPVEHIYSLLRTL